LQYLVNLLNKMRKATKTIGVNIARNIIAKKLNKITHTHTHTHTSTIMKQHTYYPSLSMKN